ncbi:MAG: hypothetical protein IPJ84_00520 [Bdellovibrionales bacterium]|nr:hypothetical protein [Bdellovibrionales bacterium]
MLLSSLVFGQQIMYHLLPRQVVPFTWIGTGGDTNWSNPANWFGGSVPGPSDTAIFDSNCSAFCNATVDVSTSVGGVSVQADFTGTITQAAGQSLTVGASGWTQSAGTFNGGSSPVYFNTSSFALFGGTYNATTDETVFSGNSTASFNSGTFNHSNGTWRFATVQSGSSSNVTYSVAMTGASVTFYNLIAEGRSDTGWAKYQLSVPTTKSIVVAGTFTIGGSGAMGMGCLIGGGNIELKGNLVAQNSTCSNSDNVGNLIFNGTGAQTYTFPSGVGFQVPAGSGDKATLPAIEINKSSGSVTANGGTTDLVVQNFTLTAGSFDAPTGTLTTRSNFTAAAATTFNHNGGTLAFEPLTIGSATSIGMSIAVPGTTYTIGGLRVSGGNNIGAATYTLSLPVGLTLTATGDLTVQRNGAGNGSILINNSAINVAGNLSFLVGSNGGSTLINVDGIAAKTIVQTAATVIPGSTVSIDKTSSSVSETSAVALSTAGQNLTITSGIYNMAGFNLSVNNTLTISAGGSLLCNGGTVTYSTVVINGAVECGADIGITWTGATGDGLWSTAGNWTNNVVPGPTDIALFNALCVGANCNVAIDSSISVKGLRLLGAYTGTMTQNAGSAVTIGSSGYQQAGGIFLGGNSAVSIAGAFELVAGTFTSTSGTLSVAITSTAATPVPLFTQSAGTFNHNSGLVALNPHTTQASPLVTFTIAVTPGTAFHNLSIDGSSATVADDAVLLAVPSGTLTVDGTLTHTNGQLGGQWKLNGDLVVASDAKGGTGTLSIEGGAAQTYTSVAAGVAPLLAINKSAGSFSPFAGTVDLSARSLSVVQGTFVAPSGNLKLTQSNSTGGPYTLLSISGGTFTHGGGTVVLNGKTSNATGLLAYQIDAAIPLALNDLDIDGQSATASDDAVIHAVSSGTVTVDGVLTQTNGQLGGAWVLNGNLSVGALAKGGSGTITFASAGAQTYTSTGIGTSAPIAINKASGSVGPDGGTTDLTLAGFDLAQGTFDAPTGTMKLFSQNNSAVPSSTQALSQSPSLFYKFEEASGTTVIDSSGNSRNATIVNPVNVTLGGAGYEGSHYTMANSGQVLLNSTLPLGSAWTISAWIKTPLPNNGLWKTAARGTVDHQMIFNQSTNEFGAFWNYNSSSFRGTGVMANSLAAGWHHFAVSLGGGNSKFYVDGVLVATIAGGPTDSLKTVASYTGNNQIVPELDNFSAFTRTLSDAEIADQFSPPGTPVTFFTAANGTIFNHNSGTVEFAGNTSNTGGLATFNISVPGGVTLNNVNVNGVGAGGNNVIQSVSSGNLTIAGTFTHTKGQLGGSWILNGDANFTAGAGGGTGSILFSGGGSPTITVDPAATMPTGNVTIAGSGPGYNLSGTMTVNGPLVIGNTNGATATLSGGTIHAKGNLTFNNFGYDGSTLVKVSGTASQTVSGISSAMIPDFQIISTGGTVSLTGNLLFMRSFTYTSGTVAVGTSNCVFSGVAGTNTITPGALAFNSVTFNGAATAYTLAGNMVVNGVLTVGDSVGGGAINSNSITANGDVIYDQFGYAGTTTLSFGGATATTFNIGATATVPTGTVTINKTGTGKVTLQSNASFTSAGQDFTISSGVFDLAGYNLAINDLTTVSFPGTLKCSGGAYTSGTVDNYGTIDCLGYELTWTGGGGDSNWNNPLNWSGNAVPGVNSIPTFSDEYCGANCNATINVNASVRGIRLLSTYTGTITQASGSTVTTGTSAVVQDGGTFTGGDAAISISGPVALNAGTFTATSATTSIVNSLTVAAAFTFNHGNGTVSLATTGGAITCTTCTFYNLNITGSSPTYTFSGVIQTAGTLTLTNTTSSANSFGTLTGGTIEALGNVVNAATTAGTAGFGGTTVISFAGGLAQTYSQSNTGSARLPAVNINKSGDTLTLNNDLLIRSGLSYTAGTVNWNGRLAYFADTSQTINSGTLDFGDVTFGCDLCTYTITGTAKVQGTLRLYNWTSSTSSKATLTGGTIEAYGDVVNQTTAVNGMGFGGTTSLSFVGTGAQTYSMSNANAARLPRVAINKPSGTLSVNNHLFTTGGFTYTAGTVAWGTGIQYGAVDSSQTVTPGALTFADTVFACSGCTFTLSGTMSVGGNLSLQNWTASTSTFSTLNGGTISLEGNLNNYASTSGTPGYKGTTNITFSGSGNQSYTQTNTSAGRLPAVTISKSGGTLTVTNDLSTTGGFTYTAGTVSWGTSRYFAWDSSQTLTPGTLSFNSVGFSCSGCTFTVSGNMTIAGNLDLYSWAASGTYNTINNGNLDVSGNVTVSGNAAGVSGYIGSAKVRFQSGAAQSIQNVTATAPSIPWVEQNNAGTTVTQLSQVQLLSGGCMTINAGTWNMNGYALNVNGSITNSGTLRRGTNPSCGTLSYLSFTGNAAICP